MKKSEFTEHWNKVLQQLSNKIDNTKFNTFFRPLTPVKVSEKDGILYFSTVNSSKIFQNSIDRYETEWKPLVEAEFGKPYTISVVEKNSLEEDENPDEPILNEDKRLNPYYTFDTFVTGANNQLAVAASVSVADGYSKDFNPLFLYGGSGLGKTHLMQAIGQYVLKNHPKKKVLYVTSETFTNEIVTALQSNTYQVHQKMQKIKDKYRNVDYLLLDDVQFIAGKDRTEEELFNTFDELYNAGKQIVFTSDKAPKDLGGIPDRLISRFQWGITVDIQPPDYETRMAILKNKAAMNDLEITPELLEVLDIIAQNIQSNIRELEGAFTRVLAHSKLTDKVITKDFAKNVLSEVFNTKTKELTPSYIKETVAKYFGVRISDMESQKRARSIAYPRQIAIYLIRTKTKYSLPNIGDCFGGRDHTTILHSYEKISEEIKTNQELRNTIENIERMLTD